jgi:hypothetical protein
MPFSLTHPSLPLTSGLKLINAYIGETLCPL